MDNSQIIIILLVVIVTILIAICFYLLYMCCLNNNTPIYPIINKNNNGYNLSGLNINTDTNNTNLHDTSDNLITPTFSRVLEIRPSTPVNSPRRRNKQ